MGVVHTLKSLFAGGVVLLLVLMVAILFLDQPLSDTTSTFRDSQSVGRFKSKNIPTKYANFFYQTCQKQLEDERSTEFRRLFMPYCIETQIKRLVVSEELAHNIGMEASKEQAKNQAMTEAKSYFEQQGDEVSAEDQLTFADWYRRIIQYTPLDLRQKQLSSQNFYSQFSKKMDYSPSQLMEKKMSTDSKIQIEIISFNRQVLEQELQKTDSSEVSRNKKIEKIFSNIGKIDKNKGMAEVSRITQLSSIRTPPLNLQELANVQTNNGSINLLKDQFIGELTNKKIGKLLGPFTDEIENQSSNTVFFTIRNIRLANSLTLLDMVKQTRSEQPQLNELFLDYLVDEGAKRGNFQLSLPEIN